MREAIELIIKAWTEPEPFGWEGEYYQFRSVSIWPRPYQKPLPQLLMSATNPESAEFAAKYRAIMGMVFVHDLGWGRSLAKGYRKAAWAHGWEPGPEHILVGEHIVIADSDEEALEIMKRGHDYLHRVLMRPQRDAQRLVIEKTRFFGEGSTGQLFQAKLATIKARTRRGIDRGRLDPVRQPAVGGQANEEDPRRGRQRRVLAQLQGGRRAGRHRAPRHGAVPRPRAAGHARSLSGEQDRSLQRRYGYAGIRNIGRTSLLIRSIVATHCACARFPKRHSIMASPNPSF